MEHHNSSYFIRRDKPINPRLVSFHMPTLTLGSEYSTITLHFDTFQELYTFSDDLVSLINIHKIATSEDK